MSATGVDHLFPAIVRFGAAQPDNAGENVINGGVCR